MTEIFSSTDLPGGTIEQAVANAIRRMKEGEKRRRRNDLLFDPEPGRFQMRRKEKRRQ